MAVVDSDLLPPDPAVMVIPLLADYPAVKDLKPELEHDGQRWVLATRPIAAVRRSSLRRVDSVADPSDRIHRAVDVLMAGVSLVLGKCSLGISVCPACQADHACL
jgi:toxin CcdB